MKKILLAIAVIAFGISCNNAAAPVKEENSQAKKNIEIVNSVDKLILSGDVSKLGDYIAADAVDHAGPKGDLNGLEAIKAYLGILHKGMPDMKWDVLREFSDSEYVMQLVRNTGTCADSSIGMPVGAKMDMTSVEVVRLKDGKAVEHWSYMSMDDMMKMMPPPPPGKKP